MLLETLDGFSGSFKAFQGSIYRELLKSASGDLEDDSRGSIKSQELLGVAQSLNLVKAPASSSPTGLGRTHKAPNPINRQTLKLQPSKSNSRLNPIHLT